MADRLALEEDIFSAIIGPPHLSSSPNHQVERALSARTFLTTHREQFDDSDLVEPLLFCASHSFHRAFQEISAFVEDTDPPYELMTLVV